MRRAAIVVAAVFIGVWACSSSDEDSEGPDSNPEQKVDQAYCERYCTAQVNAGTLEGTRDDCIRKCCKNASGSCAPKADPTEEEDGGTKGDADVKGDGSTCDRPCGQACCSATEGCRDDGTGSPTCIPTCTTGKDCASGCCAPLTNANGDPIGPYVCKPNDGQAYNCCKGITVNCQVANTCCVEDANKNVFCALKCTSNTQCGAAHCVGYEFGTFTTTCSGPTACGP